MPSIDDVVERVRQVITRYEVAVMSIKGGDGSVPFSYTVGLTAHEHPELILVGSIETRYARQILTMMALREIKGERPPYKPGDRYSDVIQGYDVIIGGPVDPVWDEMYRLRMVGAIYGGLAAQPLQVIYPDRFGTFPWQEGYEEVTQVMLCPTPQEGDSH